MRHERPPICDERDNYLERLKTLAGEELDREVAAAIGTEVLPYSSEMGHAWKLREWLVELERQLKPLDPKYSFLGPEFKGQDQYMTAQGFPLGTEIWYVSAEPMGKYEYFFDDNPAAALCRGFLCIYWYRQHEEALDRAYNPWRSKYRDET